MFVVDKTTISNFISFVSCIRYCNRFLANEARARSIATFWKKKSENTKKSDAYKRNVFCFFASIFPLVVICICNWGEFFVLFPFVSVRYTIITFSWCNKQRWLDVTQLQDEQKNCRRVVRRQAKQRNQLFYYSLSIKTITINRNSE